MCAALCNNGAVSCNLNIDMGFRAMLFGASLLFYNTNHQTVTKALGVRLVDEFCFGYNQPTIINLGQKLLEAL